MQEEVREEEEERKHDLTNFFFDFLRCKTSSKNPY